MRSLSQSNVVRFLRNCILLCKKTAINWKIFVIQLFADEYAYIHFLWIKYIKSLTVLNYQGRYCQTLLFWGKTVKFCAQVARNLIILSNIHLWNIYFKLLLNTVKVHYVIKDVSYDAKPKTFNYLFWSVGNSHFKNQNHEKLEVQVIFYVTINHISVIYVTALRCMCSRTEKHRHGATVINSKMFLIFICVRILAHNIAL